MSILIRARCKGCNQPVKLTDVGQGICIGHKLPLCERFGTPDYRAEMAEVYAKCLHKLGASATDARNKRVKGKRM